MKHRYYVSPLDNLGSVEPKPPRDRTWVVMDRKTDTCVAEFDTRREARNEAKSLNQGD